MGQVSPKYMYPSAPYGGSQAVNALNSAQPLAQNPQTPLLPPNFTDPGTTVRGVSRTVNPQGPTNPITQPGKSNPFMKMFFGQ